MIINDFDIEQIAESGECFRWNKIKDKYYSCIIGKDYCEVWQEGNNVEFSGISQEKFNHYFDLERDYSKIKEYYILILPLSLLKMVILINIEEGILVL